MEGLKDGKLMSFLVMSTRRVSGTAPIVSRQRKSRLGKTDSTESSHFALLSSCPL